MNNDGIICEYSEAEGWKASFENNCFYSDSPEKAIMGLKFFNVVMLYIESTEYSELYHSIDFEIKTIFKHKNKITFSFHLKDTFTLGNPTHKFYFTVQQIGENIKITNPSTSFVKFDHFFRFKKIRDSLLQEKIVKRPYTSFEDFGITSLG